MDIKNHGLCNTTACFSIPETHIRPRFNLLQVVIKVCYYQLAVTLKLINCDDIISGLRLYPYVRLRVTKGAYSTLCHSTSGVSSMELRVLEHPPQLRFRNAINLITAIVPKPVAIS